MQRPSNTSHLWPERLRYPFSLTEQEAAASNADVEIASSAPISGLDEHTLQDIGLNKLIALFSPTR